MSEVCLVDGVGRPRLLDFSPDDPPEVIEMAHEGIRSGPARKVKFDRQPLEVDPDGRVVYRMRAVYRPDIRVEYLRKQPIEKPFKERR